MAFPTIQTADTKNGVQTSNSTSWTITYPTNIASGDLLLLFVGYDGSGLPSASGWTVMRRPGAAASCAAIGRIADGTETGTFTLTMPNEMGGWRVFRITGWFGSGLSTDAAGGNDGDGVAAASGNTGSPSTTPDPPSLDPTNWATEDTLWFATCGVDTSRTISAYPYADNNSADVSGGAGGATLGVCTTTSAVSSLDPGTFTISNSDDWVAITVAVRPAAVGVPASLIYQPGLQVAIPRSLYVR